MLDYAICEISGKQYKVLPNIPFEVSLLAGEEKTLEVKVLLLSEDGKLKIGNPYLKETLKLDRLANTRGEKIRVAKFHAKANFRKVEGSRAKLTKIVLSVKKA